MKSLIEEGYPPEAVFVELALSGEGGYTVEKLVEVGMVKQMNYHSQTSQYGQMTRGIKFRHCSNEIAEIQRQILKEIETGKFYSEIKTKRLYKDKLDILKHFAYTISFSEIEKSVRKNLGFKDVGIHLPDITQLELSHSDYIKEIKESFRGI
jgi:ketol-acid reductoisomerase